MKIIVTPDDWSNARIVPSAELATAIAALAPGQYDLAFATPQGNFEVKPVDVPEDPPVNEPADPVEPPVDPVDVTPVKLSVLGGRVAILNVEAPGAVRQVDGSFALDLSAVNDAETRTFTTAGEQQVTLDIAAPSMKAKWGEGIHYMLERDTATEDLIIEPGRNHRKVYVTNGSHGYTPAMIAAEVGGLTAAQITTNWLKANPAWGASPDKALAFELGLALWQAITGNKGAVKRNLKVSHWLLLECGYTYDNSNISGAHFIPESLDGESLLHPCVITRYGTGHPPIIAGRGLVTYGPKKLVIVGISNSVKANQITGDYIIFADWINEPGEAEINISQTVSNRTLYRCQIADVHRPIPNNGATWSAHFDRLSGLYMNHCHHALIEDCFFDHNGWKDGWTLEPDYLLSPSQPVSIYSHNMYLSYDNRDLTLIGTLTSRGSSMGLQMRSGGRIQDNLFIDNQMHGFAGEGSGADYPGNYTLALRNFFTSVSHMRPFPGPGGAFKSGFEIQGKDSASIDNVIAHMANPNDPAEIASKDPNSPFAFKWKNVTPFFDNHVSFNWGNTDKNIDRINPAQANARTIQNFAATKLPGDVAPTIKNFLNWMKTLTPRQRQVITREALDYLREPYDTNLEMSVVKRTTPAVCVFRPDPRGEGFLWDNPMNWSTGDLPGTVEGDTVDLHGNFVRFGRLTVSIPIDFNGGKLDVVSGKLTCTAQTDLADVTVRNSGQYFAPENAHGSYIVSGGRLAFTGAAAVDLDVSGEAECLIGPALTIMEGVIQGSDCWVGWDGTGTATATGPLAIMEVGGKVGKLQRFKRRGDAPNPAINATYALTALNIDVTTPGTYDLGGGAGTGVTYTNPDNIALPPGVTLKGGKLTLVVS